MLGATELSPLLGNWANGERPLYSGLAKALRDVINQGQVAADTRLPAERKLANALRVSRTTVVAAYNLLRSEGLLRSRQGGGTWVTGRSERGERASAGRSVGPHGLNPIFRGLIKKSQAEFDFLIGSHGGPPELLESAFRKSLADEALAEALGGGRYAPLGLPELRRALAERYTRDGLRTNEDEILITSGAQQAIALAAAVYLSPGSRVAIEDPTYLGAIDIFTAAGAVLVPLPVDEDGARVDVLPELAGPMSPSLVFLIPTFQNPTGTVLAERRRREIVQFAEQYAVPVIDDRALADLSVDGRPVPPLAGYSKSAPILTIGSLSKVYWGGLRVGWFRAPEQIIGQLAAFKAVADLGSSLISQLVAVDLVEHLDEARAWRREQLNQALNDVEELLSEHLPDWTWRRPAGGLSLWVQLPRGNASGFAQIALRHDVAVLPGWTCSPDNRFSDHLRLQFVHPRSHLETGIRRLADAWKSYSKTAELGSGNLDVVV